MTRADAASYPRLRWCGDTAFAVEFASSIDDAANRKVLALDRALQGFDPSIVETIPTYRSLLVHCDVPRTDPVVLAERVLAAARTITPTAWEGRSWRVPVVYGGPHGIDLEALAVARGLTADDVIRRHAAAVYRVAMIGFMPGFTYLAGLDPALATPRMTEPRVTTPAGSVSIGGVQAAVSSVAAPSAWHLIGRTPARLFDPDREPPCLFAAGDTLRFEPIDAPCFAALEAEAAAGAAVVEQIG